jgi:hypothetical protein
MKLLFGTALAVSVAALSAQAQDWRAASRACAEKVARQLGGCGSCSGAWPQISRCVVDHVSPDTPAWATDACVGIVGNRTQGQPGAYDRIRAVLDCATRKEHP